jgi:hypothetical protein
LTICLIQFLEGPAQTVTTGPVPEQKKRPQNHGFCGLGFFREHKN